MKRLSTWSDARFAFALSALGSLLLLAVFIFSFLLPLSPSRMAKSSAALISEWSAWTWVASLSLPNLERPWPVAILVLAATALAMTVYGLAVLASWHRDVRPGAVRLAVIWALIFFALNAAALPNLNRNIYNYMLRARAAAVHGVNPYTVGPAAYPDDPIFEYADQRHTHGLASKLPAWMLLSVGLAKVAGDDPVANLFVYRLALLLLNAGCLGAIVLILRRHRPEHLMTGVIVYGWNPIVIMYGQSKTDILMVFLLLLTTGLLLAGRRRWATIPLTLSIFVKLFTLPLLMLAAFRELRHGRWKELVVGTLLVGATVIAVYAPFWSPGLQPELFLHHMNAAMGGGRSGAGGAAGWLLKGAFLLFIAAVGFTRKKDDAFHLVQGWVLVLLVFSLLVAKFASADYLMTLIALAAVTLGWRTLLIAISLSGISFFYNIWYVTFTPGFTPGDQTSIPKEVIYLSVPLAVALGVLVVRGLRALAGGDTPDGQHPSGTTPHHPGSSGDTQAKQGLGLEGGLDYARATGPVTSRPVRPGGSWPDPRPPGWS